MGETSYNEFEDDFEDNFDMDDENEELEFGASWTINAMSLLYHLIDEREHKTANRLLLERALTSLHASNTLIVSVTNCKTVVYRKSFFHIKKGLDAERGKTIPRKANIQISNFNYNKLYENIGQLIFFLVYNLVL